MTSIDSGMLLEPLNRIHAWRNAVHWSNSFLWYSLARTVSGADAAKSMMVARQSIYVKPILSKPAQSLPTQRWLIRSAYFFLVCQILQTVISQMLGNLIHHLWFSLSISNRRIWKNYSNTQWKSKSKLGS